MEKVELFSNGKLFEKTQFQAWEHFDAIAKNSQMWKFISKYDRMSTPTGGGMITLKPEELVHARIYGLTQRLKQIEAKPVNSIGGKCTFCESDYHTLDICPNAISLKAIMHNPEEAANWVANQGNFGSNQNPNWQRNQNQNWQSQRQQQKQLVPYAPPTHSATRGHLFRYSEFSICYEADDAKPKGATTDNAAGNASTITKLPTTVVGNATKES